MLKRLLSYSFFQSQGLQESMMYTVGTVFAAGFTALATMLMTRWLGPAAYGEFSAGFAVVLLLSKASDLGLTVTLQKFVGRRKDRLFINQVFSSSLRFKLVIIGMTAVASLIVIPQLSQFLKLASPSTLYAAVICVPFIVMYEHFQAMLQSLHAFKQSVLFTNTQAILKVVIVLLLMVTAVKSLSIVLILFCLMTLVPVLLYRKYFPAWVKINIWELQQGHWSSMRNTAIHAAVGVLCIALIEQLDTLFVKFYLTSYETGLLSGISKISLLVTVVAYSIGSVLNTRVARYRQAKHLYPYIKKAALFGFAATCGFFLLIPITPFLIYFTIGDAYSAGSSLLVVALAASCISLIATPFVAVFFALDKPWLFSLGSILQVLVIVIGNIWLLPVYGLEATVWTRVVSQVVLLLMAVVVSMYTLHVSVKRSY